VLAESICLDSKLSIVKVPADKNRHHLLPLLLFYEECMFMVIKFGFYVDCNNGIMRFFSLKLRKTYCAVQS
jgi:hypothetical protein